MVRALPFLSRVTACIALQRFDKPDGIALVSSMFTTNLGRCVNVEGFLSLGLKPVNESNERTVSLQAPLYPAVKESSEGMASCPQRTLELQGCFR